MSARKKGGVTYPLKAGLARPSTAVRGIPCVPPGRAHTFCTECRNDFLKNKKTIKRTLEKAVLMKRGSSQGVASKPSYVRLGCLEGDDQFSVFVVV